MSDGSLLQLDSKCFILYVIATVCLRSRVTRSTAKDGLSDAELTHIMSARSVFDPSELGHPALLWYVNVLYCMSV